MLCTILYHVYVVHVLMFTEIISSFHSLQKKRHLEFLDCFIETLILN